MWENTWQLAEWVWDVGPELAMQAQMKYVFGRPEPPTFDFKTSDIDAHQLVADAMPKDGPKGSGARDALKNRAEWKGKLKEQRQDASKIPPELAAKQAKAPVPKGLPPKPSKKAPPSDLKSKDPAKVKDKALKELKDKGGPIKGKELDKAHQEKFDKGMAALEKLAEKAKDDPEDSKEIVQHLAELKKIHGFTILTHTKDGDDWVVDAAMSPGKKVKVNAKPPPPLPSKVKWKLPDDQRGGVQMIANPLAKDIYDTGTDVSPGGVNPIFREKVGPQKLTRDGTKLYVEGHLLNNKLGGRGDERRNLTPLSYKANIGHWRASEKYLQNLMTDKSEEEPMAYYKVEVDYPDTPRRTKSPVIAAEGRLAESITVTYQRLKRKSAKSKETEKVGSPVETTVKNVPPYPHA